MHKTGRVPSDVSPVPTGTNVMKLRFTSL